MKRRSKKQIEEDIKRGSKVCTKCGERKPYSDYPRQRDRGDGYYPKCRQCINKGTRRTKVDVSRDNKLKSKVCTGCGERKSFSEYYTDTKGAGSDGMASQCKVCNIKRVSLRNIMKKYNLTKEEYEKLIANGCEMCGSNNRLCVDHNHDTGEVRGCLCSDCNSVLGFAYDSPKILEEGIKYLKERGSYEQNRI